MAREALVTAEWLEARLEDPSVRVIEIGSGSDATYAAGHIPGALWGFWKGHCWHATERQFVTPERMAG
ncbi:MAG: hypothetical protein OXF98_03130, partial [Rhodospirillaceae bacterium]|nr:hypothetical protein [Rhodospirillaceae bacterium]